METERVIGGKYEKVLHTWKRVRFVKMDVHVKNDTIMIFFINFYSFLVFLICVFENILFCKLYNS